MLVNLLLVVGLSIFIYWAAPKVQIDPQPITVSEDVLVLSKDVHSFSWKKKERMFKNKFIGPESFTHNPETVEIYTGTNDGMIWKINKDMTVAEPVIRTGDNHERCGSSELEETCGRVLGLKYLAGDKLIVADSYKGIMAIHLDKKTKQVLVRPDQNMLTRSLKFFNSVDVSKNGVIYFTVSSSKWVFRDYIYSSLEGDSTGKVFSYDLKTKELKLIASNLSFANGVSLTPDENNLIVAETLKRRLLKINLLKETDNIEIFVENLDGFPDNIKRDENGDYFVAMPVTGSHILHSVFLKYPVISRSVTWLIPKWIILTFFNFNSQIYKVDNQGNVIALIDGSRLETTFITEAYIINKKMLFGSLVFPYFDVIHLE